MGIGAARHDGQERDGDQQHGRANEGGQQHVPGCARHHTNPLGVME